MKTKMFVLAAGFTALAASLLAADSTDEQQIKKIEQDWLNALVKRDAAFLTKLEADDFAMTGPDGMMADKAADIKNTIDGDVLFDDIKVDTLKVRFYGDTAIANGVGTVKAHSKGGDLEEELSGQYAWTDVFVKQKGEWKAVSAQVTQVAPKKEAHE